MHNSTKYWMDRTAKELRGESRSLAKDQDLDKLGPQYIKWLRGRLKELDKPSVLEVGCGFGRWSEALDGLYSRFVGGDIVPARIEYANKTYIRDDRAFHTLSPDGKWTLGEKFDVVVFITVIQHLPLDLAVELLKTARRHLKEGGRLILMEWRIFDDKDQFPAGAPAHMISKLKTDLEAAVPDLGWSGSEGRFVLG